MAKFLLEKYDIRILFKGKLELHFFKVNFCVPVFHYNPS